MTRDHMRALVNRWSLAVARNDVGALGAMVAPRQREGVLTRARAIHAAFREIEIVPVQVVVEDDVVAWRFRLAATHVGPLGEIAATQRAVVLEGVNFQRVRDAVVVEHWTTVDLAPLRVT
jgi:hypothetical protein